MASAAKPSRPPPTSGSVAGMGNGPAGTGVLSFIPPAFVHGTVSPLSVTTATTLPSGRPFASATSTSPLFETGPVVTAIVYTPKLEVFNPSDSSKGIKFDILIEELKFAPKKPDNFSLVPDISPQKPSPKYPVADSPNPVPVKLEPVEGFGDSG